MKARNKRQLDRMHVWTLRRFHDATDPRFMRYWLAVRTKIQKLIAEEGRRRYMLAHETRDQEAFLIVVPPGSCNWCGKTVKRKNARFCPGVWEEVEPALRLLYPNGKRRIYHCYNVFFDYWVRIPRFKRVVFLRDNFTCKACGARPIWTNKFGIVFPDLNQLACDHIIPVAKGGKTELANLQTLCRKCNGEKGDKLDWKPEGTVTLDEWFQLSAAQKVADQGGFKLTWRREFGGIIIGMGRSNANITDKRRRPKGNPEYRPS